MAGTWTIAIGKLTAGAALVAGLLSGTAGAQQGGAAAGVAARINDVALAAAAAAQAAQAAQDLGHLSVVNQGTKKYRYARSGVVFDLVDRHGRWTREEALAIRDALDGLPLAYLRKARASGTDTLFRDGAQPTVPLDSIFGDDRSHSAIAVPMWPYQFIAIADRTFRSESKTRDILVHELAHCVHWRMSTTDPARAFEFARFSWLPVVSLIGDNGLKSWNGFPTNYARSNFLEDFAVAAAWYWHTPDELRRTHAGKYAWMRDHVFDGVVSPASARDESFTAIERVRPKITRLSSYSGGHLAVRDVYGEYFMAPGDGGYNTVRFSQVRALQVPVSRTHMYATVPASCNPSRNWQVTVETQDGKSDGVRFEVERAWWRFW